MVDRHARFVLDLDLWGDRTGEEEEFSVLVVGSTMFTLAMH